MTSYFNQLFRPIPTMLREALPAELQPFEWNATSYMAKAWFGNKALHYELWVRYTAKVIELGLHFESDALTNARLYGAFRTRAREVTRGLGSDARIESWDKGWARIWEPFAIEKGVDTVYAERIRSRFVYYVRVLEPMLRDELPSDVDWKLATPRRNAAARAASGSRASRSAR